MGSKKRHAVNDAKQEKEMPEFTEIPLKKILSFQWSWKHLIPVALLALGLAFLALPPQNSTLIKPRNLQDRSQVASIERQLLRPAPRIYLIWTTPPGTFKERNYDVLEAYFYHHPDAKITILVSHIESNMFQRFTRSGYDLSVVKIDPTYLHDLSASCPGKKWIDRLDQWKTGPYFYSHITDYLRFCLLYKNGGIYSDFDAILLQRINANDNFIGKDSAGADGHCKWCLPGGDIYLAPGIMGTVAGHHLPKDALTIGFEGEYDPKIFNQVGPMAVTKAYRKDQSGMNVYERAAFYPYNYLTSWNVFVNTEDPMQKLERLKRTSLSLHLYGHKTRNMAIHENSVLMAARSFFRVTEAELSYKLDHSWELRHPQHIGMAHDVEELAGFRIMASVEDKDQDIKINRIFSVTMSSTIGSFRLAESADWQSRLELNASSPALLNAQLSRLLFSKADNKESRGTISVFFRVSDANSGKSLLENHSTLSVYNLGKMTTIMVKTMGRMDKVFNLVSSCSNMYPEIKFIVSDDAANLTQTTGDKKKFYYLALPYDVGLSAGRNRMLELIETEYFVTLDDDFTCDANSKIDVLLHALETEGSGGTVYDIAAAKNPADEGRFGLDFCGHMSVRSQVLHLEPGKYESHQDCHRVDFVPNIFLGRTASFKNVIQWDETLKLGEHEDFFLRAKAKGIKTLTCPSISFQHNQVEHWLKKTAYDVLRNRVYDFWRDSLKKHGLTKLVSFGTTMMDLIPPPPVSEIKALNVLARSLDLDWVSPGAQSWHLKISKDGGHSFRFLNDGQGEGYEGPTTLQIFPLRPGAEYIVSIYAGNRFEYESEGRRLKVKTLTRDQESALNLLVNPSFEKGHFAFTSSLGSTFHVVESSTTMDGRFVGRTQISTKSYMSPTVTETRLYQELSGKRLSRVLQCAPGSSCQRTLTLTAYAKLEAMHVLPGSRWTISLAVETESEDKNGQAAVFTDERSFDFGTRDWQSASVRVCLAPSTVVKRVRVQGSLDGFRGSALWDQWVLRLD